VKGLTRAGAFIGMLAVAVLATRASTLSFSGWPRTATAAGPGRMVGAGVARFIAAGVAEGSLPPSFALVKKLDDLGPTPAAFAPVPRFEAAADRYAARIEVPAGTSLYGTGEIAGPLLRNGRVTETWNTDQPGYGARHHRLYQSHPWVLAVRRDGSAFGVLADTSFRCEINLKGGIGFSTAGHPFPVYVLEADSPQGVLKQLAELTGTMALPPLWSLGYQQCRWSYYPEARVREIADGFRSRHIPCDVIWLDIHYMDGYRIFTFSPERFPDPKRLNDYLHQRDFKSVWMIDPGVKKDPGYFVYDQGMAGNHFVLAKDGQVYNGSVWPGPCAFPDFSRPETRAWWAGLYKDFLAYGIDGIWNDMNDPSVFNTATRTMPVTNRHQGGGGLPAGTHDLYHNVYGMLMARATREGVLAVHPDRRPFVLTRSNFIGGQRYAATWTGDNLATWAHLKYSVAMVLNLGMSGQPFSGPDIGGFSGKGTPEMFARWFGVGAFFPFCRGHAAQGNIDKEPWAFGPAVEKSCRMALERRYRLLPYYYTLFSESATSGLPIMRPVFFADPTDPKLRAEEESFLIGDDLLVLAQLGRDANHKHVMPRGIWRAISLVEGDVKDPNQPELRVRGGAILPLGRVIENTARKSLEPLTLVVSLDAHGKARGRLYEDAGEGFGYLSGDYLLTTYAAEERDGKVEVRVEGVEGRMARPEREVVVELVTDDGVVRAEGTEGAPIVVAGK